MPSINEIHEKFKDQGLSVLLVNMREDREVVRRAVATRRYTAPVLVDADGAVADAYRVTGTPTVYLLDRRLHIVGRAVGRREWASENGHRLVNAILSLAPGRHPAP